MLSNFLKSFKLTFALCLFFSIFYVFVLWLFAQAGGPNKGNAELATLHGRVVGAAHIGQHFTKNIYFWGRPSHAGHGYDASRSAGSNKGPSNEEYLASIEARVDSFLVHHPYLTRADIPAEIVTASGSGLDPHISPKAAYAQAKRVADARGWSVEKVRTLVQSHIKKPLLGLFGTETVNVLQLNIALDEAANTSRQTTIGR